MISSHQIQLNIIPGTADNINVAGITYYKNLIQELKDNNIEPLITLYHWDLPQPLQELGGWVEEFIVEAFADYAKVCFELLGDNVKYWLTFNEAKQTCLLGYGDAVLPPMINQSGILDYKCTHNVLKAHARAYHIYDSEFRPKQKGIGSISGQKISRINDFIVGKISITIDTNWFEAEDDSEENEAAAETKRQFNVSIISEFVVLNLKINY